MTHGLVPASAFSRFFRDAIVIRAATRASANALSTPLPAVDVVAIAHASVSDAATAIGRVGYAEDAWQYTIEFPATAWTAAQPPAPGSIVDAGARWPRLYVQEASRNGALWHLVCSAREVPQ